MLKIQWTGKLTEYITAVNWSKKGDLAVSSAGGDEEGCLFLWENEDQLMDDFKGIEGGFSCLQWDFLGKKLAVGSDMGEVFIFA